MTHYSHKKRTPQIRPGHRKTIETSQQTWFRESSFVSGKLPIVLEPVFDDIDILAWAEHPQHRMLIRKHMIEYGGVLLRNCHINTVVSFEQLINCLSGSPLAYHERSSPRSHIQGHIYTSTDHPAEQSIFPHNEQSYNRMWPRTISFFCERVAQVGGETPLVDCRKVFQRIDPTIRQRFIDKHYMYVRNFGAGFGLTWQTAFQTTHPAEVETYCQQNNILFEWLSQDRLRTRQVRPVMTQHPETKEMIWFNHATFFHISTLEVHIRDALRASFAEADLPNNVYYGDGTIIEDSIMDELRSAYLEEQMIFPWQQGDMLILDNMLTAHGRSPFVGPRKVVVAMTEPTSSPHEQNA